MHKCMSTHTHISSAPCCQQQTAEIFTIQVFLIKDFIDLLNVRSTQLPHILLSAELFPQWRKGYFPAYCLFTLPAPRTSLHTSTPHYPILSVLLHLSHIWFCMRFLWSQDTLDKNEKWGKIIPTKRLSSLARRTCKHWWKGGSGGAKTAGCHGRRDLVRKGGHIKPVHINEGTGKCHEQSTHTFSQKPAWAGGSEGPVGKRPAPGQGGKTGRVQRSLCSCTEENCSSVGGQTLKENAERWWRLCLWGYSKPIWTQYQVTCSSWCHFEQWQINQMNSGIPFLLELLCDFGNSLFLTAAVKL